jgi:hypothetical protein
MPLQKFFSFRVSRGTTVTSRRPDVDKLPFSANPARRAVQSHENDRRNSDFHWK